MNLIKDNKKKILVVTLLTIILVVGGLFYMETTERDEERYTYEVEVTIEENVESTTLIIPFPIKNNESYTKILDSLKVKEGDCDFQITDTEYGVGLKLNISRTSEISSEGHAKISFEDFRLSLGHSDNPDHPFHTSSPQYWIYASDNCSLSLEYVRASTEGSYSQSIIRIESNLGSGWQLVGAETESLN